MTAAAPTASKTAPSTHFTYAQIEGLWIRNGGSRFLAPLMAAIALAESRGDPEAHNTNAATGDDSVGLWQINFFGRLLGPRTKAYGSKEQLLANPDLQARAAVSLAQNGRGLGNWTTFTHGAWKEFYDPKMRPDFTRPSQSAQNISFIPNPKIPGTNIPINPILPGIGPQFIPFPGKGQVQGAITGAAGDVGNALLPDFINAHNAVRFGQGAMGFVLVILGLIILTKEAGAAPAVVQVREAGSDVAGTAYVAGRRARGRPTSGPRAKSGPSNFKGDRVKLDDFDYGGDDIPF